MIRLTRKSPGHYTAMVTVKGAGGDPFEANVYGPGSQFYNPKIARERPGERWMVETDTERFFGTMAQARDYLNRFFNPAKPVPKWEVRIIYTGSNTYLVTAETEAEARAAAELRYYNGDNGDMTGAESEEIREVEISKISKES
jgi:hypothetical protein